MSLVSACIHDLVKLSNSVKTKEQEIEKRREVITKYRESETVRRKNEHKKEKLSSKEILEKNSLDRKIEYYHKEIKAAEEKFEKYRAYCLSQIEMCESKAEAKIQSIETDKNGIDDIGSDEDSDKVLIRLKKELEQINDNIKDTTLRYNEYKERDRRNREEEARMRQLIETNQRRMEELARADERRNIQFTESFYSERKEEKEDEPYESSYVPPPNPELAALMSKRKEDRIKFKKSSLFTGLTTKQQKQYRELDYEDQDKIHVSTTIAEVKNLLKEM